MRRPKRHWLTVNPDTTSAGCVSIFARKNGNYVIARDFMINQTRLAEAKDNVLRAFKDWLQTNNWLFYDSNPRKQKKKEAEFKKIMKLIDKVDGISSLSELLGFALWCQNYVANFGGVSFGLGIHGDPVKSFYTTHAKIDVSSSERLAQALALVLRLQC